MIVDTSALMALVLQEDRWQAIETEIERALDAKISSATYVELFVVLTRRYGKSDLPIAADWLQTLGIRIIPFSEEQAVIAREAYMRFGKGRHPAALNFGDCFSYALAKHLNEPLLFKGEDFRQTDVFVA